MLTLANATSAQPADEADPVLNQALIVVSLIAVHFANAIFSWVQIILSLNRYQGIVRITFAEWIALLIYVGAGIVRVVASLATASSTLALQMTAATIGSLLAWSSFIVLYNDSVSLPSRQQMQSIVLGLGSTVLWELNGRLIVWRTEA